MIFNILNTGSTQQYTPVKNVQQNNTNNYAKINFGHNLISDKFENNSLSELFDEKTIKTLISQNSKLQEILTQNNIPIWLNMKELKELQTYHLKDTQNIASGIAKNLPPALRQNINMKTLKEGAMLHDFGKVLIPPEILNKNSTLTPEEHMIMDLHSEIGYQLLKNSKSVDDAVLNLVRYHHQNTSNPYNRFVPDINLQVINLADKYSALTESRTYKTAFSPDKALEIIYKDVQNKKVHPFLFNALVKSVQQEGISGNVAKC